MIEFHIRSKAHTFNRPKASPQKRKKIIIYEIDDNHEKKLITDTVAHTKLPVCRKLRKIRDLVLLARM